MNGNQMMKAALKAMTCERRAMSLLNIFPEVPRKPLIKIGVVHGTNLSKMGNSPAAVPKYSIVVMTSGDRI
jgi:hypothetical protein